MSQDGEVAFFRVSKPENPRVALRELLEICSPQETFQIERIPVNKMWSYAPLQPLYESYSDIVQTNESSEVLSYQAQIKDAVSAYREGFIIVLTGIMSSMIEELREAIQTWIPESIRGGWEPLSLSIWLGPHVLAEYTEIEEGHLFAAPFLSIRAWGYGIPNQWREARRQILMLHELNDMRGRFESKIGPLGQCIYWNG